MRIGETTQETITVLDERLSAESFLNKRNKILVQVSYNITCTIFLFLSLEFAHTIAETAIVFVEMTATAVISNRPIERRNVMAERTSSESKKLTLFYLQELFLEKPLLQTSLLRLKISVVYVIFLQECLK